MVIMAGAASGATMYLRRAQRPAPSTFAVAVVFAFVSLGAATSATAADPDDPAAVMDKAFADYLKSV